MPSLSEQQIKEIAEELDFGLRCFWHKHTGELLFVPDIENEPYADSELFDNDLQKLESNADHYIEIEKPNSKYSFEIMAKFTEQLANNESLKNELMNALTKKKPFREFKFLIDNSREYRQQWFDFKNAMLKQWVRNKFNETTCEDNDNGNS